VSLRRSTIVHRSRFACSVGHRVLHSFPTRRSSDLDRVRTDCAWLAEQGLMTLEADVATLTERGSAAALGQITVPGVRRPLPGAEDRKSTRLNSSHVKISYAVFCLKKKTKRKSAIAL